MASICTEFSAKAGECLFSYERAEGEEELVLATDAMDDAEEDQECDRDSENISRHAGKRKISSPQEEAAEGNAAQGRCCAGSAMQISTVRGEEAALGAAK